MVWMSKNPILRKRMGDCLLLAISKGYDRIVELLLNTDPFKTKSLYKYSQVQKSSYFQSLKYLELENHFTPNRSPNDLIEDFSFKDFYTYNGSETRYSPDITPLILASQSCEYGIIQMLLRRDSIISKPHKYNCLCSQAWFLKSI